MVISRVARLLFIHIPRTGGTSVHSLLARCIPDTVRIGGEHETALSAMGRLGGRFHRYYSFSFVRNPWDRMVSWYSRSLIGPNKAARRFQTTDTTSFNEFLQCRKGRLFANQIDCLTDRRGELLVDDVFRFENYLTGVGSLCNRFGLDIAMLPHRKSSRHAHYSAYYTDETRDVIAKRFAHDIAAFGYTFGN